MPIPLLFTGCRTDHPQHARHATTSQAQPSPLAIAEIENAFKLTDKVYSGGQPEGPEAFAALQRLGIKTILSVDAAQPDLASAAKYNLIYIHLPMGYDGIAQSNAWLIARAVQLSPGPVFIHCHHGRHRGPAAAALACTGVQGWDTAHALAWMQTAGTATNYTGLYRSVREFQPPSKRELDRLPTSFPAHAKVSDMAGAMVAIDRHFEALKAIRSAGFRTPSDQPDLSPANQSLILWESLRETHRLPATRQRGDAFAAEMAASENAARDLREILTSSNTARAEPAFQRLSRTCASCHKAHRD